MFPARRISLSVAPVALLLVYSAVRYGINLTEIRIHWWNDLFWTVTSLFAGLTCLHVYRSNRRENRAWLFFALGHLAFFAAMLVWSFYEIFLGQLNPFPSPADIGFLGAALFFALGVSTAGSMGGRSLFWGFTVSKVAVVATGTLLIAAIWLADAVAEAQTDRLYTAVALGWTVGFSTVFVYACVAFWTNQLAAQGRAAVLVVAALGVHAFVSILYTEALLRDEYKVGSWFDVLWMIGFTLFWWAALEHRTGREAADKEDISGEIIDRIGVADSLVTSVFILGTFGAVVSSEATPAYLDKLVLVLGSLFAAAVAWRGWEFYRASTRAAAEREGLVARLRIATAEAEAANAAKDDFLSAMSHEIRTPLTGLLGVAEILKMEPLTQKQQDYVRAVRDSGRHLLNVINDILDFSRIEAGYLQLEQIDFSLKTVLERLRSMVHPTAVENGLELHLDLSEHSPPILKGDPTRLNQVLINLVGNAIKFTEKGSVTLTVASATAQDGQLRFRFEVRDTGTGIAPERHAELFTAFMQADRSIARRFGGSGLGLAISRRLVNAMGGEIGVDSAPGLGSLFWFEVPFELGDPGKLESERALPFADVRTRRILIAEDVKLNQDILRDMLSKQGHELVFADNGLEALDLVRKEPFDLVLMDVQMPVMDGIDATRRIRQLSGPAGQVPIVALTANVTAGERDKYLSAGMNDHQVKPIDWEQLQAAISRYGRNGKAEGPLQSAARQENEATPLVDPQRLEPFRAKMTSEELASWIGRSLGDAERSCGRMALLPKGSTELTRTAHDLKGLAGTFGLMRISRIAAIIEEKACHSGETDVLVSELKVAVAATREELQQAGLIRE